MPPIDSHPAHFKSARDLLTRPRPSATIDRRRWIASLSAAIVAAQGWSPLADKRLLANETDESDFRFRFLVGSSLYGYAGLDQIVPQVRATGATAIDIWPKVHGNQREQLDEMGEAAFAELLARDDITLGCITQYKLGPFGLRDEMRLAQRFGCRSIVTGAVGPRDLSGAELKSAIVDFVEKLKPHLAVAEETGVTIAIENHAGNLIWSLDAIRWLADLRPSNHLAIALAPYHLDQDPELIAELIRSLGDRMDVFYAWQHGKGSMTAQPKEAQRLQLPGRGDLDFAPIVRALRETDYQGWTEVFMHPYPRGTAVDEDLAIVTAEIKRGADHLQNLI